MLNEYNHDQALDVLEHLEDFCQQVVEYGHGSRVCFSSNHCPYIHIRNDLVVMLEDQGGHIGDWDVTYIVIYRRLEILALTTFIVKSFTWWLGFLCLVLFKGKCKVFFDKLGNMFRDIKLGTGMDRWELRLYLQWILFAKRSLT
ncbi:unnamed protein product [Clonostachys rosea]|uniref:Uncharacterized protein n=1 Tax=Bionectria ochroleuca TaxID=29856 RepID=A0ABY6UHQ4_BIOOC|nr:unnamed protein product [Clonostachys rosea]